MAVPVYQWPIVDEFLDREQELATLQRWWDSPDRTPVALYGRRRCGKSWLCRRFADGRPAVVLVARRTAPGAQLDDFAERIERAMGFRPAISNVPDLIRALYRTARDQKVLAIIDEFPYLLPSTESDTDRILTAVAAVMEEERDHSQLKLVLSGSIISQMEALLGERAPLHGRLQPLQLHPVTFAQARLFLPGYQPAQQLETYAIAGGMPRYLTALATPATHSRSAPDAATPLRDAVCQRLLDPNSALWDEGRTILDQELREPKVYFGVLQALSHGDKDIGEVASAIRSDTQRVSKYLSMLATMRLVERRLPAGAGPHSRLGHWHLRDQFLRFWFRFVFPFQDDLESGLAASTLYDTEIAPVLPQIVGSEFEELCRRWTRSNRPVTRVAAWWGPSLNALRRAGKRSTEEIDIVGTARGRVALIGEARWRSEPFGLDYLNVIDEFKIPALRQSGLKTESRLDILLFSRAGYSKGLREVAADRDDITLVEAATVLT